MWSVDMAVDPVPGSTEPVFSAIARQTAVLLVVISKPKARLSYPERPTRQQLDSRVLVTEFERRRGGRAVGVN